MQQLPHFLQGPRYGHDFRWWEPSSSWQHGPLQPTQMAGSAQSIWDSGGGTPA